MSKVAVKYDYTVTTESGVVLASGERRALPQVMLVYRVLCESSDRPLQLVVVSVSK